MNRLVDRFLKYVKVDTKSDPEATSNPSTQIQFDLGHMLVEELKALGLKDVMIDEHCYVTATLPSTTDRSCKTIGLIAHMDTSPDYSGKDVKPQIIKSYDGSDIVLNERTVMSVADNPELNNYIGNDIITTDGTTLLGADNKAGIAEIMEAVQRMMEQNTEHGEIKILFTPDEEVGRGTDKVNLDNFKVDHAYTIDGGEIGELEYENFNAASLKVIINGKNYHPGKSKNKMVNSILLGVEFQSMLPQVQAPQHTEGYEGFYHLNDIKGNVEHTELKFIIRDHNMEKFQAKKAYAEQVGNFLNEKYGAGTFEVEIKDSYFNMREKVEPVIEIVEIAKEAMEELGIKPLIRPIRGGTDGARLSFMGVPTPNVFTGGHNYHGRFEYIPVQSMEKAVDVVVRICEKTSHTGD